MKRIYETDSYIRELSTIVTASGTDEKGRYFVELEDTIFFPEEGGQNADSGILVYDGSDGEKMVSVLDGIISGRNTCSNVSDSDEIRIRYTVSEPVREGTPVLCRLDWNTRFDRMQNHSGEHILSGIMHRRFGVDNVGFHLSDTGPVTLDFNKPLSYEQVMDAQDEANGAIYKNLPISVSFPSKEELETIDYRSKIDIDGQVRLVTIGGNLRADDTHETIDICACCAPHVAYTGEIGILKVLSVVNWKGGIRVSILCGRRALEYINREHDILTDTARRMSTEISNVPVMADSYRDEIVMLKAGLAEIKEKLLLDEVDRMGTETSGTDPRKTAHVIFTDDDIPAVVMKNIYNALCGRFDGFVGVFAGNDEQGYRYNAGSRDKDSRELAAKLKEAYGAKGGGSEDMVQGKVMAAGEAIAELFSRL